MLWPICLLILAGSRRRCQPGPQTIPGGPRCLPHPAVSRLLWGRGRLPSPGPALMLPGNETKPLRSFYLGLGFWFPALRGVPGGARGGAGSVRAERPRRARGRGARAAGGAGRGGAAADRAPVRPAGGEPAPPRPGRRR